jgi:hypothetical protein
MLKRLVLTTLMSVLAFGIVFFQPDRTSAACSRWQIPSPIVDYVIAPQDAGWTSYFCPLSEQDFFYGKIKAYNSGNTTEKITVYLQRYEGDTWKNVGHFAVQKNGVYHNNASSANQAGSYFFTEYNGKPFVVGAQYRLYMDNSSNNHDVHIWIDQAGMYFD